MNGSLFSAYFLEEGVRAVPEWQRFSSETLGRARSIIGALLADFAGRADPNEANTESDFVEKLFDLLGWTYRSKQEKIGTKGRTDVPDYLLFLDAERKRSADTAHNDKYKTGAAICEGKRWGAALDHATRQESAPSTQILRYLGSAGVQSNGDIRFGLLTNGRCWRLYDNGARSKLEGFVEFDLTEVVADEHALRSFLLFFGHDAFAPNIGGTTVLSRAIADSRSFEARVTDQLARTVFDTVYPALAEALAAADPQRDTSAAYFADLREAALTWLYRLLFVLYAEDRDLLPTRRRADGLSAMRDAVATALDAPEPRLSDRRANHDRDLRDLWQQIDEGDRGLRIPPYNGGLFKRGRSALLDRSLMPDTAFAPLLDALSRERTGAEPRRINYRDLNVQHLGSVYERLLEFDFASDTNDASGKIVVRPQTFARKTSGSYYTPEELVMLVIRRTVGPLLDERRAAFVDATHDKARKHQDATYRNGWLTNFDPATKFLELRIVDPAMGSGHFLVSLVDYLADQVMLATEEAAELVEGYRSPLLDRLANIRARIEDQAREHGWAVEPAQLIDRQLVRRIILKRVIHGVDKNPMAVELAKLSLWLHTFTVGAPLSFLDHHLRCGDSLFGEWVASGMDRLERGGLLVRGELDRAERSIGEMAHVEDLTDADITEVHESAASFAAGRAQIRPLERFFDLLQGYRWIEGSAADAIRQAKARDKEAARATGDEAMRLAREAWNLRRRGSALDVLLDGSLGEPEAVLDQCYGRIGEVAPAKDGDDPALAPLVEATRIAGLSNFLHWELAFPTVWRDWRFPERRSGGFDAVIGNPPWDRLKMQEVEWFAARRPAIAYATRAADRARMVRNLKDAGDDLSGQYALASGMAGLAGRMANLAVDKGGEYPLLGKGDVNLYSLFVERASRLVKPDGIVGLLVPSGISGDLGASAFFRSISTTGRLGSLLDYENKKIFFPDVHASFKFSAIVFGGSERKFAAAQCGFFLRDTDEEALAAATFPLAPADFAAVNPNTGTAPVFRTVRDAELTTAIYARLPVLVRREFEDKAAPKRDDAAALGDLLGGAQQVKTSVSAWPVRYLRMFDMTNDSHLFRTRAELVADGWYPVAGGRMKKGPVVEAVPLYEGKMVQAFDHRAANVTVNEKNLKRAAQPEDATLEQHQDPSWSPQPQFLVELDLVTKQVSEQWNIAFKSITAPTNMRTMIAGLLPICAVGNSMGMVLTDKDSRPLVYANLNAFALDYVLRQKVQGQNLNWFIVEQLPVIPPAAYDRSFGPMTAREIVAREVLHLTYTAHDMTPFARDTGYDGAPFVWSDADRRQRRARLDALYFHLYGLSRDDAEYILSTFPIVEKNDRRDHGRYLTRDLILAQMAALDAGDPDAIITPR